MFSQTFYFSLTRKYTAIFGKLFDDIKIKRFNKAGELTEVIDVPLLFGSKDKMMTRVEQDPTLNRQEAVITLPAMSFEMVGLEYDGSRKLKTINRKGAQSNTAGAMSYQYSPVPWNFNYRLYVSVKNYEDGTKIIEQILPYFTPDWTTPVILIPEINEQRDIPIVLKSVAFEDNQSADFKERKSMIWTLDFVLKGYLYGPVRTASTIKFTNVTFYLSDSNTADVTSNSAPAERLTVQPGLLANGSPTTNSSASIPYANVQPTDNYDYAVNIIDIQANT